MGQRHTLPKTQKATIVSSSQRPIKTSYLRRFRGAFGRRYSDSSHWDGSYYPDQKSWKFRGEGGETEEDYEDEYTVAEKETTLVSESMFRSDELPFGKNPFPKSRSWHSDQICDYGSIVPVVTFSADSAFRSLTSDYSLFSEAMWNMLESKQKKWEDETNQLIRKYEEASERKLELWKEIHKVLGDKKDLQRMANDLTKDVVGLRQKVCCSIFS